MANLLSNTTIGGYQSIHTGNVGSYALTSLPSHNHDDRYYTESESDSRYIDFTSTQNVTGIKYFFTNNGYYSGSTDSAKLQVYATGANAAFMSFHRGGSYAVNFGLDADNVMRIGGWSAASNRWQLDMSGNNTIAGNYYGGGAGLTGTASSLNVGSLGGYSLDTMKKYIWSRGENLLTNGTGLMGNNTNFSSFTFDGSQAYFSSGSFRYTGQYQGPNTDELMPVNPEKRYRLDFWAKTANGQGAYYAFLNFFDVDGNAIVAPYHMYYANTLTTLAQTLNPGDTVAYLTSVANWENGGTAGVSTHIRSFIFWNYSNSFGYLYPPQTYSRNWYPDAWNPGAINSGNNTITLRVPWSGPSIAAGTQVSNGSAGGTYKYIALGYTIVPTTWTNYVGIMDGVDYSGSNAGGQFPPGTAAAKLGFLTDYNASGDTIYLANLFVGVDNDYPIYDRWTGNTRINKAGAFYGTIFYDSNNDGYYLDPNSTSNLYRVDAAAQMRAPIFYDSQDTNYYLDPNSTSRLDTVNANTLRSYGNVYTDGNFGHGLVGLYSASRYQGVFAMGDSYKLTADGTGTGTLYGIAWTHTNVGGQSKSGLGHQALFMDNGVTQTAIGSGIWTNGLITTTSYGTSANWKSAYDWGNHASAGYLTGITSGQVTGALGYTPYNSSNPSGYISSITSGNVTTALGYTPYNASNPSGYITSSGSISGNAATTSQKVFNDLKIDFPSGGSGGYSFGPNHYSMGLDLGNGAWSHPHYKDLIIGYHTGIRLGASYSGIRFYNNSPTTDTNNDGNGDSGEALLMTIGGYVGTANYTDVVVNNNLIANVSLRAPIFYDSNDTSYYLDPNGNSVLTTATFNVNASSTLILTSAGTNASQIKAGAGDELYIGGNNSWQMRFSGANVLMDNGGYLQNNESLRAPIFYDSQDTNYYVDPNSTSNLSASYIGRVLINYDGTDTWFRMQSGNRMRITTTGGTDFIIPNTGEMSYNGNTVIHTGNIGSQSVSYASTAGSLSSMNISQFTNNSGYITGISFANVSSKPTTISGYGITDAITTSNIGSQSVSYAATAGSAPNGGNINSNYDVAVGVGNGLRFWGGSDSYKISMGVGALYQYGPVTDYSIKMQMNDSSTDRGFTWGRISYAPIAALNSTSGDMEVAGYYKSYGYRGNGNVGGTGTASWHPDGIYCGSTMWQYGTQYKNNTGIYDVSELKLNAGPTLSTYNSRNLTVRALDNNADVGILGQQSGGGFAFQIYGTGSSYGFLNGIWAAWDIRKAVNGAMYMNDNDSYYLQTNSTSNFVALNIQGNAVVHAGNIGSQSVSYATTAGTANAVAWTNVSSRPTALSQFTNDLGNYGGFLTSITAHSHAISDVSGLQTALDGKQASGSYLLTSGKAADSELIDGIDSSRILYGDGDKKSTNFSDMNASNQSSGFFFYNQPTGNPFSDWTNWINVMGNSWNNNYGFQIAHAFHNDGFAVRRVTNGSFASWRTIIDSGNIGSQSVSYASSAGSVAWTNVSSRPTALSQFSNDLGNYGGWITSSGSISGSAGSVTGLTLTSSANGINPDSVTQNQIGYNTSVSLFGQTDGGLYSSAYSSSWIHQIYGDFRTGQIAIRGKNSGSWQAWRTVLDSSNYTSYAPGLTGSGASGTWGINVTGSAGSVAWTNVSSRPTNLSQFTNDLGNYGGWQSASTAITTSNIGSQSVSYASTAGSAPANGGNSSTVGGYAPSGSVGANTVVIRDANNYIYAHYINSNVSESENPTINSFYTSNGDGWLRKSSVAHVKSQLGLGSMAYESSGTYQTVSGAINTGNIGSQSVSYATTSQQLTKFGDIYGQDWNSYYINGKMIVSSVYGGSGPNFPTGAYNYGAMLSYGVTGSDFFQVYFPENGALQGGAFRKLHYRTGWNGSWSAWKSVVDQEGQVCTIAGSNQTGIEIHSNVGYNQDPLTYFLMRGQADTSWKALKVRLTGDAGGQDIEFRRIAENGTDARMWYIPRGANTVNFDYPIVQPSDSRLKDNITPISTPVDKIKSLRGVEFDWNSGEQVGTHDVGLIAQDVEAVLPEAVTTQEDGYKNLAYAKVIPLLVEAMKEQQAMIEAFKAEIELLKNK